MTYRNLQQLNVRGKRVLTRVDFNVPIEDGRITDDTRITSALPTIQALTGAGAAVLLMSHLGRPKGKVDDRYSMKPVARHLSSLLGHEVPVADDVVGPSARSLAANLERGQVAMLENLRFEPGEEANDDDLALQLASLADCYVNDAFGAAHRAHASTAGVAKYLPSAAGYLMAKELDALGVVLHQPRTPFLVIMGGAKISDKIGIIQQFLKSADAILVGGGIANTLLAAQGAKMGRSLVESTSIDVAKSLLEADTDRRIVAPVDFVVAPSPDDAAASRVVTQLEDDDAVFDIGPETIARYTDLIKTAQTIVWNGPMGLFEVSPFDRGTRAIAESVADSGAYSIVGGGDSVAALQQMGLADRISHISTGGGASLEFLEGKTLPGVAALEEAPR